MAMAQVQVSGDGHPSHIADVSPVQRRSFSASPACHVRPIPPPIVTGSEDKARSRMRVPSKRAEPGADLATQLAASRPGPADCAREARASPARSPRRAFSASPGCGGRRVPPPIETNFQEARNRKGLYTPVKGPKAAEDDPPTRRAPEPRARASSSAEAGVACAPAVRAASPVTAQRRSSSASPACNARPLPPPIRTEFKDERRKRDKERRPPPEAATPPLLPSAGQKRADGPPRRPPSRQDSQSRMAPASAGAVPDRSDRRAQSLRPSPRCARSAEPIGERVRAGSLEPIGAESRPSLDPIRAPPRAPNAALNASANASMISAGEVAPMGQQQARTRQRADEVAADQNSSAKSREDSLLRMLDCRRRGVL